MDRYARTVLAVPFVGKDVPSRAAEFANPEVLIALTVLAYRYERLRLRDTATVVRQLKSDLRRQPGPFEGREAFQRFEVWVRKAGVFLAHACACADATRPRRWQP